jgi:hypothetical protein
VGENSLSVAVELLVVDNADSGGVRPETICGEAARRISGGGTLVAPRRPASEDTGVAGGLSSRASEEATRLSHFVLKFADCD